MLSPLLLRTPPRVGSRRPGDLLDQLRMAWGLRGLDVRGTAEATRLFTMSIADVLDEWFESPEVKGVLAINGVIGTWAGPEEPGTAYVMMHHTIGDVGDGHLGSWGYPIGGMGAVADAIRRVGRVVRRRGAHVVARRAHRRHRRPRARRRHPRRRASSCGPRSSSPPPTRRSRSSARSTRPSCPPTSSPTCGAGARRSGTVKVNVALSELPDFLAWPGTEPHERFTGSVELCHSIDYLQRAFQDAREGRAAGPAVLRRRDPVDARPDAGPEGTHVMSLFTQWVPSSWSDEPHAEELEQYADRVIDGYTELAPELQAGRSSTAR